MPFDRVAWAAKYYQDHREEITEYRRSRRAKWNETYREKHRAEIAEKRRRDKAKTRECQANLYHTPEGREKALLRQKRYDAKKREAAP